MKKPIMPIPVDADLKSLIEAAAIRTHLSQSDIMRSALRIGVPEVVKRLETPRKPRRNLAEYADAFAGLIPKRNREMTGPSRFK